VSTGATLLGSVGVSDRASATCIATHALK
jgi:hypothetical protein